MEAATPAPAYEVVFERGSNGKNYLSYRNGSVDPHSAAYRPADSINGNPLFSALEVVIGGLPSDIRQVHVSPKSDAHREALKQECANSKQATIAFKTVTFRF